MKQSLYRENKLEGETLAYYQNGKIRERSLYKNNQLDGEVVRYDDHERVREKVYYKDGKPYGEPITYDQQGNRMGSGETADQKPRTTLMSRLLLKFGMGG